MRIHIEGNQQPAATAPVGIGLQPDWRYAIEAIAKIHGFDRVTYPNLDFKPWILPATHFVAERKSDLGLLNLEPDAIYFGVVGGCYCGQTAIAFRFAEVPVIGDPWRYEITVEYIAELDGEDPPVILQSSEREPFEKDMTFLVFQGVDDYEILFNGSVRIELLDKRLSCPVLELLSVLKDYAAKLEEEDSPGATKTRIT